MVSSDAHVCMQDRRAREGAGAPTLTHRAAVQLGSPPLSLPPTLGVDWARRVSSWSARFPATHRPAAKR
eukprot:7773438-Alexandrium_andersonii.AAC.1